MDRPNHFQIIDCGEYYVIENMKADDFERYHTHINKKRKQKNNKMGTCKMLIKLVCNKNVPKSPYLRESAKRISRDEKYINEIRIKEEKDSQKPKFIRVNRGRVANMY